MPLSLQDVCARQPCRPPRAARRLPCLCVQRAKIARLLPLRNHSKQYADSGAQLQQHMSKGLALLASGLMWLSAPGGALALEKISEFGASGLFLKDSVETLSLEDPDVKGVTVYITDFKRSLADKLAKDFFSEPSQASVTCAVTGPISVSDEKQLRGSEGKEIFSEGRSGLQLFKNKTVRVRRVFDEKHKTLLYIAYSTRLGGGNDEKVSAGRYKLYARKQMLAPSTLSARLSLDHARTISIHLGPQARRAC